MKKALITGSETFGNYITNPTKWLAQSVNGKAVAGYEVHSLVLPSVVHTPEGMEDAGTRIVKEAQSIGADVIVSFGMASDVKGFRLERSATNWVYNEKYLTSEENNHRLDATRPDKEQVHADLSVWDIDKMKSLFEQAELPFDAALSDDPGQYSCNSWIYRTLRAMDTQQLAIPYLFVHMACTEEAIEQIPDFDRAHKTIIRKEDTVKALDVILQSLTVD